jgi:hypothetical protein
MLTVNPGLETAKAIFKFQVASARRRIEQIDFDTVDINEFVSQIRQDSLTVAPADFVLPLHDRQRRSKFRLCHRAPPSRRPRRTAKSRVNVTRAHLDLNIDVPIGKLDLHVLVGLHTHGNRSRGSNAEQTRDGMEVLIEKTSMHRLNPLKLARIKHWRHWFSFRHAPQVRPNTRPITG